MSEGQGPGLSPDEEDPFDWRAPPARVSTTPARPSSTDRSEAELEEVGTPLSGTLFDRFRRVTFGAGAPPGTPDTPLDPVDEPIGVDLLEEQCTEQELRQIGAEATVRCNLILFVQ